MKSVIAVTVATATGNRWGPRSSVTNADSNEVVDAFNAIATMLCTLVSISQGVQSTATWPDVSVLYGAWPVLVHRKTGAPAPCLGVFWGQRVGGGWGWGGSSSRHPHCFGAMPGHRCSHRIILRRYAPTGDIVYSPFIAFPACTSRHKTHP